MTKLLVVETSARGAQSVSRTMTRRFVEDWIAANPGGEITTRDLAETPLVFTTGEWLTAYFTPPEHHTDDMKRHLDLSDRLVQEVIVADHVVVATPVYNFNIPAALKAWVDYVVRKGLTLGLDGQGLLHGKRATVLIASGGVYTEGSPIRDRDIATQYLRLILNYIGISDVTFVAGGNAKSVDLGQDTMQGFVDKLAPEIAAAAR